MQCLTVVHQSASQCIVLQRWVKEPAADINISNANLSPLPPIRVNSELMMMMIMMMMTMMMLTMMTFDSKYDEQKNKYKRVSLQEFGMELSN